MVTFNPGLYSLIPDSTMIPEAQEAVGNPDRGSQLADDQIAPAHHISSVLPVKRKHTRNHSRRPHNMSLHQKLVHGEMLKIRNLPNDTRHSLETLLDHHQIAELSKEPSLVLQLRLLYFTIGSCQSLLAFKETLRLAREMPDSIYPSGECASGKNMSTAERFQEISRLNRTEALCVLLRRCHIVILFETERQHLCQRDAIIVETPSTFGTGQKPEMGNPEVRLEALLTEAMMYKMNPGLRKETDEFKKLRGQVTQLRRLAKLLRILTGKFGFGILALLPSGPAYSEFNLTDNM